MVDSLSVLSRVMDFQSAMETFAEAWVAANVTQVNIPKNVLKVTEKYFCEKCTNKQLSNFQGHAAKRQKENKRCCEPKS